jgi:hypothetical protein
MQVRLQAIRCIPHTDDASHTCRLYSSSQRTCYASLTTTSTAASSQRTTRSARASSSPAAHSSALLHRPFPLELTCPRRYAIALGFAPEIRDFQPFYVWQARAHDKLRIGADILREAVALDTDKRERSERARKLEKEAADAVKRNVRRFAPPRMGMATDGWCVHRWRCSTRTTGRRRSCAMSARASRGRHGRPLRVSGRRRRRWRRQKTMNLLDRRGPCRVRATV